MNSPSTPRSGSLSPRFKELLQGCRQMARSHLAPLFMSMLDNADIALLEFAERAENNAAQLKFFDAMGEIKKKRLEVEQEFFKSVDNGFRDFISGSTGEEEGSSVFGDLSMAKLALVDKLEVEESLPILNMVGKARTTFSDVLYGINQRMAVVNGGSKITDERLPGGPEQLARAARAAFSPLRIDGKTKMVVYMVFERYVMRELQGYYDEFNRRLINAGLLPNLRYEIRKQHDPRPAKSNKTAQPEDQKATATDQTVGEETFDAIRDLLSQRHRKGGADGAPGGAQHVPEAVAATSRVSILGAINNIQTEYGDAESSRRFNEEIIEAVVVDQELLERLKSTLIDERERLYSGIDRRKVAAADSDIIDLVGMLFEFMLQDNQLPNSVKALLSRLHTPFLKVAIVDKQLFTEKRHPARRLLDMMAEAGARWVTEDDLERGIFPAMRIAVERVLVDFKDDLALFDELIEEFSARLHEVERKAEAIEKRTVEAADGQARLQVARERSHDEIEDRVGSAHLTRDVQTFLRNIWVEKLTFILLREREGEQSGPWKLGLQLADDIVWSIDTGGGAAKHDEVLDMLPLLRERLRDGLDALRAYGRRDNEKMFDEICRWQDEALSKPEPLPATEPESKPESQSVPVEEQAAIPAANVIPLHAAAASVDIGADTPSKQDKFSDEVRQAVERLAKLEFNTWFEFFEPDGRKHRWKLAWYSTVSSKYMFVDAMGVKAGEFTRIDLAQRMCQGKARLLNIESKPFLDRALDNILSWLGRDKNEAKA